MSKKQGQYTPEEAAKAVLDRVLKMYKNSNLYKSNTAHEVEAGSEPTTDNTECPQSLCEGQVSSESSEEEGSEDKKKKHPKEPEHEMDMSEEEEEEHDAQENEEDEMDMDDVEADEEEGEEYSDSEDEKDKKIKDVVEKSEEMDKCGDMKSVDKSMSQGYASKAAKSEHKTEEMEIDLKKKPSKLKKFLQKKKMKKCGDMDKNMAAMDKPQSKQGKMQPQKPQEKPESSGVGY